MARIRTIKPEFWGHPIMGRRSEGARLMAIALLNLADDEGYFLADAILVRNFARPYDRDSGSETAELLQELSEIGYLEVRIHASHGPIGKIIAFNKHQSISKPSDSKLKQYFTDSSGSTPEPLLEDSGRTPSGKGREGKGKEGSVTATDREPESVAVPGGPERHASNPELPKLPDFVLPKLRVAFGISELDVVRNSDACRALDSVLAQCRQHPLEQVLSAIAALLARGAEGKHPSYLLTMVKGGAKPAPKSQQSRPSDEHGLRPIPSAAETRKYLDSMPKKVPGQKAPDWAALALAKKGKS